MALYPFVVNGNTYDLNSFQNFAYTAGIPNSMADILRQALLLHSATSSSSVSIGTGAKSLTVTTGRAYRSGDSIYIASSAAPQTNRMYGQVTSYNFTTGALNVNITGIIGSGTLTSWYIGIGGVSNAFSPTEYMLSLDNGGTGYGRTSFTQPCGFLGLNEPSVCMKEIYEDFTGTQGRNNSLLPTYQAFAPWHMEGGSVGSNINIYAIPAGGASATLAAGYVRLRSQTVASKNGTQSSTILQYSDHGFFHVGKGACVWEAKIFGLAANATYIAKMGLKCHSSGFTTDIFKAGGIGFQASSLENNGRYIIVAGVGNNVRRQNTNIIPSTTFDKLRIEIDHDGLQADYYINNVYVGTMTGGLPTNEPQALLAPAFETQAYKPITGSIVPTGYYIDYVYLRKFLLR